MTEETVREFAAKLAKLQKEMERREAERTQASAVSGRLRGMRRPPVSSGIGRMASVSQLAFGVMGASGLLPQIFVSRDQCLWRSCFVRAATSIQRRFFPAESGRVRYFEDGQ
jgi:hypothetical protein